MEKQPPKSKAVGSKDTRYVAAAKRWWMPRAQFAFIFILYTEHLKWKIKHLCYHRLCMTDYCFYSILPRLTIAGNSIFSMSLFYLSYLIVCPIVVEDSIVDRCSNINICRALFRLNWQESNNHNEWKTSTDIGYVCFEHYFRYFKAQFRREKPPITRFSF
jgi:hypothetical protein